MSEKVKLEQIKFDSRNANKGTPRGRGVIENSIREFGFADAGTLDRNNVILGGNKRTEVAGEIGMDEAIIIDVDGKQPVFIRRLDMDLSDPNDDKARRLAYALNRSSELSLDWDLSILMEDMQAGIDMTGLFSETDLSSLMAGFRFENGAGNYGEGGNPLDAQDAGVPDVEFKEYDESVENDVEMCECPSCGHKFPK